jgi:hypothetical protein
MSKRLLFRVSRPSHLANGGRDGAPGQISLAPKITISLYSVSNGCAAGSRCVSTDTCYYDRNVRDAEEFAVKLRYLHRNPVKRGLVKEPGDWSWSSFRHYALREVGVVEIESEWTARDRETKLTGGPVRTFLIPG